MSFFSDLDNKSFFSDLDEPQGDFFADLPQEQKKSFYDRIGQGLVYQMKSGGASGAPSLSPEQAKNVAVEVGTQQAVAGAFAPLKYLASLAPYAPRALGFITGLGEAATTGAAIPTVQALVDGGELPSKEELLKEGALWAGIDLALQASHLAVNFGSTVNTLAKESGLPRREVISRLWKGAKNYYGWAEPKADPKTGAKIIHPDQIEGMNIVAQKAPEIVIESPTKKPISIAKQPISDAVAQDMETFSEVREIASGPHSIRQAQARWIVEEMQKSGNDISKFQEVAEKMPTQWQQKKGKYVPSEPILTDENAKIAEKVQKPLQKKIKRPSNKKLSPRQPIVGTKQARKRSDIIKAFQKAFKDPIRVGKRKMFHKQASGEHSLFAKITRMVKANDIETAAHEIGHNLHTTLYEGNAKTPKEQRENISKALRPYMDELKPLALYEPYGMEGFAEFTRLYVTNPETAKELAPKFYQKFENDLDASHPEMKNALLKAREYYQEYLEGTPQSRVRAQTDYQGDKSTLDNIVSWIKKKGDLDNLKTQFLDDVFPAKRLVAEAFGIPLSEVENLKDEKNLYRSLRVLKGAIGKGDVFLLHETFDPLTLEKTGEGLREILRELPNDEAYKEFNDYLIARRAMEKQTQGIETGISLGDAIIVERDLRDKYGELAHRLDKYNDSLLQYAQKCDLLSSEQYLKIKKENLLYVPFQRVLDKDKGGKTATSGNLQAGKPIKRMKGSSRDIIAPLESIIKNTYAIIVNAEKNLSGKVLAELSKMKNVGPYVHRVPTPIEVKAKLHRDEIEKSVIKHLQETGQSDMLEFVEEDGKAKIELREDLKDIIPDLILKFGPTSYPAGENIITVYEEGKPTYYEVSESLFEMWKKGTAPYSANIITKILRVPARTLRAGAILDPRFILKNPVRDTWGRWLFTKYGKNIVKDPGGFAIDTFYAPFAMLATAARASPLYIQWLKAGGGLSTMQSLDRESVYKKLQEVRHGLRPHQVISWLRKVSEIAEESNRLAEFGAALEVEAKTRLGQQIAAFAARDLSIDFAKMGLQVKALNQIIPFFNATVQGTDKLIRTVANDEDRAEFLARGIAFIVVPSLMLAWVNKDDERVKEFQDQERDYNFITFIGGDALKIPVPFETGVILHGLTQRMYNYFMKKDPEAFEGFMGSVASAMMPNFIPSLANPLIETWANKSFFTGSRIVPAGKEQLVSKYQYKDSSSATARLIGRAMAYMIGPDTKNKAASPAVIDHFINSWSGGLGRRIVNITDLALEASGLSDKVTMPGQTITEKLGLNAFTARYPRAYTQSIEKFYDNYQDATSRVKSIKYAKKMDLESDENLQAAYKRVDTLYNYEDMQRAYKAMQASQKAINNIWNDPSIDDKNKKIFIDDLYLQQIEFAKAANESVRQHRKKKG